MLLLLLVFLSLISSGSSQDYTMITVWGSVDHSTQIYLSETNVTVAGWDTCVEKCLGKDKCLVATLNESSCFLFFEGDILSVMKGTKEGNSKVSFKLKSDVTCHAESSDWFPYTTSFGNVSLMGESSYTITENSDSYSISYKIGNLNSACADWLEGKPDCSEPCNLMMMRYPGRLLSGMSITSSSPLPTTFRECAMQCYMNPTCWITYIYDMTCWTLKAESSSGVGYASATLDMSQQYQYFPSSIMVKLQFDPSWSCPATAVDALSSDYTYPAFCETPELEFTFTKQSDLVYPIEFHAYI